MSIELRKQSEKNAPNGLCVAHMRLCRGEAFTVWGYVEIISHLFEECEMTCIASNDLITLVILALFV